MQSRLEDTASKMATVGKKMSLMISAPITAMGTGSFKLYKDYESVVNKIVSLTDVSKEAWSSLEGQVKEIADTSGNSLKEVTEGFYFIASSGFQGAEALDILDKSAKAAATGLGESAAISQLLTSVLQAYGEENISAARATDILIRSVKDGAEAADMAMVVKCLCLANECGLASFCSCCWFDNGMECKAVTAIRVILKC